MPNSVKVQKVQRLSEKLKKAKGLVFFEYKGLSANTLNEFRRKLEETEAEVVVEKNTLIKLSLGQLKPQEEDLKGQTALVFAYNDNLAPIKVLYDYSKKFENFKIRGAFLEDVYYSKEKVLELGQIPPKLELLSRLLGGFKGPISNFVYGLHAIAEKKGVQS